VKAAPISGQSPVIQEKSMTKINPHKPHHPENPKKQNVNPSRHLVTEAESTAKVAKSGIPSSGKASEGIHQHRVSLTLKKGKPTAEKVNRIYSAFFSPKQVKHHKRS
jgi:hypothetical protein